MAKSAQGEDRSNFQAVGPWRNLDFGWCKATEATGFTDHTFAANWSSLKTQVGYRGAYHFFHPGINAHDQAEFFMRTVISRGLQPGDMLAIDAEIAAGADGSQLLPYPAYRRSHFLYTDEQGRTRIHPDVRHPHRPFRRAVPRKINAALVGSGARQFLDRISALAAAHLGGNYCPVYCYSFSAFLPQLAPCTGYPLWVASFSSHAPGSVAPWDKWTQWQFAGGGGQLGADQDAFNGTRADMDTWMSTYTSGHHTPTPPAPNWTETLVQALPILASGASGSDVKTAQGCLQARGYPVTIDGAYGPVTITAVKKFQFSKGLAQDGIIGQATWTKLLNR